MRLIVSLHPVGVKETMLVRSTRSRASPLHEFFHPYRVTGNNLVQRKKEACASSKHALVFVRKKSA